MNISLILGSIRPNRESEKPARFIATQLEAQGHTVDFLDLRELNFPVFADTPEQTTLPSVRRFIKSMIDTDGVIMVFPEYNHTYGSAFKNALDFMRNREIMHKPVGLVSVSNGMSGGVRAAFAARASLPTFGAVLLPTAVSIPNMPAPFPDSSACTDPKVAGMIASLLREMNIYAPHLKEAREQLKQA
jgi:chromate reductase